MRIVMRWGWKVSVLERRCHKGQVLVRLLRVEPEHDLASLLQLPKRLIVGNTHSRELGRWHVRKVVRDYELSGSDGGDDGEVALL